MSGDSDSDTNDGSSLVLIRMDVTAVVLVLSLCFVVCVLLALLIRVYYKYKTTQLEAKRISDILQTSPPSSAVSPTSSPSPSVTLTIPGMRTEADQQLAGNVPSSTTTIQKRRQSATHSITLGRNIPGKETVNDQLWDSFLKSEVLSRLEFCTITEGTGVYKGELEKTVIVSVDTDNPETIRTLRKIGDCYKERFEQEAVMYTVHTRQLSQEIKNDYVV